jgi:hypothetical protein
MLIAHPAPANLLSQANLDAQGGLDFYPYPFYNTLRWMAFLSGNATLQRWESQSIRLHLIRVAGKLLTGANPLRLKLARPPLAAKVWPDWLALGDPA